MEREDFFNWKDLNIDAVADAMTAEPGKIKEILEFIAAEMHKEVELKEKLEELEKEHEEKKHQLYKDYGMLDLYLNE